VPVVSAAAVPLMDGLSIGPLEATRWPRRSRIIDLFWWEVHGATPALIVAFSGQHSLSTGHSRVRSAARVRHGPHAAPQPTNLAARKRQHSTSAVKECSLLRLRESQTSIFFAEKLRSIAA
jgi:hypothetical protein